MHGILIPVVLKNKPGNEPEQGNGIRKGPAGKSAIEREQPRGGVLQGLSGNSCHCPGC